MTRAAQMLTALGGATNVVSLQPCLTRLRVQVTDTNPVDDQALKAAGALGVVRTGRIVQVIVGPTADGLADEIDGMR